MRTIKTIFVLIILLSINALAQNIIDPPKLFNLKFDAESRRDTLFNTEIKNFILGWSFGGAGKEMDEAFSLI